jgi:glyoxylase-like metal-dependent hydrolase (beta-lactamase superfamily II)
MRRPDVQYGGVTLLTSPEGGRYPSGNSLLISGTDRTVLIDPSIEVRRRGGLSDAVNLVAISHAHEDHLAERPLFPDLPVLAHASEVGPSGPPRSCSQASG